MRRFRFCVIGLLMAWLPLQAIAAVAMPFCPHARAAGQAQVLGAAHQRHENHSAPGQHHHQHEAHHHAQGSLQHCNNCGACNLACAPAVPASPLLLAGPILTVPPQFSAQSAGLFIPDQPQPPPDFRL